MTLAQFLSQELGLGVTELWFIVTELQKYIPQVHREITVMRIESRREYVYHLVEEVGLRPEPPKMIEEKRSRNVLIWGSWRNLWDRICFLFAPNRVPLSRFIKEESYSIQVRNPNYTIAPPSILRRLIFQTYGFHLPNGDEIRLVCCYQPETATLLISDSYKRERNFYDFSAR